MRLLLSLALLAAFGAAAVATPSPLQRQAASPSVDVGAIYIGPAGALVESDYFNVPRPRPDITRIFPCRLHLRALISKTRLAQSCD